MIFLFLLIRYTGASSDRQLVVHMPSEAPMLGILAVSLGPCQTDELIIVFDLMRGKYA